MSDYMGDMERQQDIRNAAKPTMGNAIVGAINSEIYHLYLSMKMSVRMPGAGVPSAEYRIETEYGIPHDTAKDEQYGYDSAAGKWVR